MFTIGNYLELSHAILSYKPEDYQNNLMAYHQRYNNITSAELYKNLLNSTKVSL